VRVGSPPGGSIRITSAPKSANTNPQAGPSTAWLNSNTLNPRKT
jgi:hypothetical protein